MEEQLLNDIRKRWNGRRMDPVTTYFYADNDMRFALERIAKLEYLLFQERAANAQSIKTSHTSPLLRTGTYS